MFSTILDSKLALLTLLALSAVNAIPLSDRSVRTTNIAPKPHPARHCGPLPTTTETITQTNTQTATITTTTTPLPVGTPTQPSTVPTSSTPPTTCPSTLSMGLAADFAALGASTLVSTGPSLLTGDAGLYPGTALVGFPPGIITGDTFIAQPQAQEGQVACQTAFTAGFAQSTRATLLAAELGGVTLTPGIYTFSSVAGLTGTLTLSGSGPATCGGGQFIFLIPSAFTIAAASAIVLAEGAKACNVYFLMGSSATIGAGSVMKGNFLASASITSGAGVENEGTYCALNAAVTLGNNRLVAQAQCGL